MGRRRISESDRAFRREVARQFQAAMQKRDLNQTQAARELGITKQAVSQYVRGKTTPQGDILARACAKWAITIRYRGADFKGGAFGSVETTATPEIVQLDLFRQPQVFENSNVSITLLRSRRSTLQVTIRMKQAGLRSDSESKRKSS